ncbi:COM1 protein [Sodiomyces alkalinus F11]|uniref:COM1 protein n=1 Tax=Sodiomyces alkalinus (strain CBS 110278 / VKM F-3762 / F11) TaxID=1314773 RepID=A0A3N2Q663_SODAK|nr:COM1 protein [Sodiomyces alkalinus F11]ROT42273.1 COM1 protein [Sodiomyces alkalinus F11]
MTTLKIPDAGLELEGSGSSISPLPAQAFAVTLSDGVIEDMIKCIQNGENIQLSLGNCPTFLYGSKRHTPTPTTESFPPDVFLTKPFESIKKAAQIPQITSLWEKPSSPHSDASENHSSTRPRDLTTFSASSALDSDIETLQNSIAAAEASKKQYVLGRQLVCEREQKLTRTDSSRILDKIPAGKLPGRSGPKSKYLSSMASYGVAGAKPGSLPSSPALTASGSPSLNQGYGASKQTMEKAKGERAMIVHELAAADRTYDHLEAKWTGKAEDLKTTIEKVADFNSDTQKWTLAKKQCWKELDVWNYNYDTPQERQSAIDNAVRTFDRMRLGVDEPQWQKLLPKEERGKGKVLSKVQANIAKGPAVPTPKLKAQKADDAASEAGSEDQLNVEGGEPMARSTSQPAKKKKATGAGSQVKRLLSNKPKTTTTASARASPNKAAKEKPSTAKGGRILSAEFVTNSDSESEPSENKPMAATTSATRTSKASPAPVGETKEKPVAVAKATLKFKSGERDSVKEPIKSQQTAKRPRDEGDDSSSSSGVPLAKRIKPKVPAANKTSQKSAVSLKKPPTASDSARGTPNGTISFKSTKNTSPTKSSPLATSPPTNASDLEPRRKAPPEPAPVNRKRKAAADTSDDGSSSKGSITSAAGIKKHKPMDPELVRKAQLFKRKYEKYALLHKQISSMTHPPQDQLAHLMDMRQRLQDMKSEIYKECPPAIAVV